MIYLKTEKEVKTMAEGGHILAQVLDEVIEHIKPGVSELELDSLAEELIVKKGGKPGFKKVKGYNYTLCTSTNDAVVHGVPSNYKFKEGDIVGIDCGVFYKGFYTDMAETILVNPDSINALRSPRQFKNSSNASVPAVLRQAHDLGIRSDVHRTLAKNAFHAKAPRASSPRQEYSSIDLFLRTGERALEEAIRVAKSGNRIGHISETIQKIVEESGYSVVRSLVGHGVGKKLHEEPEVPGFINLPIEKTSKLMPGMTIAIEVIYNMGKPEVVYVGDDGWTIKTADGSLSSVFEKTIAITQNEPVILTK